MSATILVIEDDPDVTTLLVEILGHEGYTPVAAEDGLVGLIKLQTGGADLALLDIMMPDLDGVRVLQQLLEEGSGRLPVPVVVMTGSPEGAEVARGLIGAANVFEKPFDPGALLRRIRELVPS